MNRNFLILLLLTILTCQCAGDSATTEAETNQEEVISTGETTAPPVVAQQPPEVLSASEVFEKNKDRYAQLYRTVKNNMSAITTAIEDSTYPEKLKSGLKSSFEEVAKFDNVEAISQTSKYTSAESIEQFMDGLEMYLNRWGIE